MITVYRIEKLTGEIKEYEDLSVNSFAGSLLFWMNMEEKYLEKNQFTRVIDMHKAYEIWDLVDDERMNVVERILMAVTFDWCFIKKEHFDIIIECFTSPFATEAMAPIAASLSSLKNDKDCMGACIAWNSVSDPYSARYDDNDEEYYPKITDLVFINGEPKKMWALFEDEKSFKQLYEMYLLNK